MIEFTIDHIIAEKLGGSSEADNLAYACFWCNADKGTDISSIDWQGGAALVRLFNPRQDNWEDHFVLAGGQLKPKTPVARVTVFLLQLNNDMRQSERTRLIGYGMYPC